MRQIQTITYFVLSLSTLPLLEGRLGGTRRLQHILPAAATAGEGLRGTIARENSRTLQEELVSFGGTPDEEHFPLKLCQGDCDEDEDCEGDLICFQRWGGEPVPGCLEGEEDESKTDYCVHPTAEEEEEVPTTAPSATSTDEPTVPPTSKPPTHRPTWPVYEFNTTGLLNVVGNNDDITAPLQLCEADCDRDADCADGLVCYQREKNQPVPGCEGDDESRNDYCVYPPEEAPTSEPTESPTLMPTVTAVMDEPTATPSNLEVVAAKPTMSPTTESAETSPTLSPTPGDTVITTDAEAAATPSPSESPTTESPTKTPTLTPTLPPSTSPTTASPTEMPTLTPTLAPTESPTTQLPTKVPSSTPTLSPTEIPTTLSLTTEDPTMIPTVAPSAPLPVEEVVPTAAPTLLAPDNDTCPRATRLTFGDAYGASTNLANQVEGAPDCGDELGAGVWYRFRAQGDPLGVQVQANFPARLTILLGSNCNNLSCIEQINGFGAEGNSISHLWNAIDGERYYAIVDGVDGATGDFNITVDQYPDPAAEPTASPTPEEASSTSAPTGTGDDTGEPTASPTAQDDSSTSAPTVAENAIGEPTANPTAEDDSSTSAPTATGNDTATVIIGGHASISDLEVVGNNNNFTSYPLQKCQGDCDTNFDCDEGLICFQRRGDEEVPGCGSPGPSDFGIDFCVVDGTEAPTKAPVVMNGGSVSLTDPTGAPTVVEVAEPTVAPTVFMAGSGTMTEPTFEPTIDIASGSTTLMDSEPTFQPTTAPTEPSIAELTEPTLVPTLVCPRDIQECSDGSNVVRDPQNGCEFSPCPETPCPTDTFTCPDGSTVGRTGPECKFEVCADAGECAMDVSACLDGSYVGRDALNDCQFFPCPDSGVEPSMAPTPTPTAQPTPEPTPAATMPDPTPLPTLSVTDEPTATGTPAGEDESTTAPASTQTETVSSEPKALQLISNNDASSGLLQVCQGDCDSDSDCREGLKCFQRYNRESVPGCVGLGVYGADYCVDDAA